MLQSNRLFPLCPLHGKPTKRESCRECNAAYMRGYLRRRRLLTPERALWDRAFKRAKRNAITFSLARGSIAVPPTCPALGIALEIRGSRAACSPSLDRIVPEHGYIPGNVRVISDRANRLKSNRNIEQLRRLAQSGPRCSRAEYEMIVTYVEREQLLSEIRQKAEQGGRAGEEWAKIAAFLDRAFRKSLLNGQRDEL